MRVAGLVLVLALAGGSPAVASAGPDRPSTLAAETAVTFAKWKAKHAHKHRWKGNRGRHLGWSRGRHRGWYR